MLIGAALDHKKSIIFRREFTQLSHIIERSREIYNKLGKFTASPHPAWRLTKSRKVELGSCQTIGNEQKYQGQPHDLICFDELPHFADIQFRTIIGWLRTADPRQRCRVIAAGNPPMQPEEEWVVAFFAPWLDPQHPNPARPGELRWFASVKGEDLELPDNREFVIIKDADGKQEVCYDFERAKFKAVEILRPLSRTFIPASVEDNPYYMASGYVNQLAAMPEPMRSKLLYGSFTAGKDDHPWQVIPSEWILAAQERWKAKIATGWLPMSPMSAMGVDVARGGKDKTIFSPRWDNFFGEQEKHPGTTTPDGPAIKLLAIKCLLDNGGNSGTKINIDIIGVGSSPYDHIKADHAETYAMNGAEGTDARDKSGLLGFINCRAQWHWQFREALDPASGQDLCLPPSRTLYVDLCAPRWKPTARGIQIEAKEDIIKRTKHSPDEGDSCIYAHAQKYYEGWGLVEVMRQQVEEKQRKEREAKGNR